MTEYKPIAVYWRAYGAAAWVNLVGWKKSEVAWKATENERLEFSLTFSTPKNSSNELVYPKNGDDIIICENSDCNKVLANACAGVILDTDVSFKGWDPDNSQWKCEFKLDIVQRDFSADLITLDYKTATNFSDILTDIFGGTNCLDIIGNKTIKGESISKYKLLDPDISVSSFDFTGSTLQALAEICKTIGYKWKIIYHIEPHVTNVINFTQQVLIYSSAGIAPGTDDGWDQGITDTIIRVGIANPLYISATDTPDEPARLWPDSDFNLSEKSRSIKNLIEIRGLQQEPDGQLEEYTKEAVTDGEYLFDLDSKARDIIYVCRGYITGDIVSVANTTTFDVSDSLSEKLLYDQSLLTANGNGAKLTCRIQTNSTRTEPIDFTITDTTITLDSAVSTLAAGDIFELIGNTEIYNENVDSADLPVYYCKKSVKPDGAARVEMGTYNKFNPQQTLKVSYYKLSDRNKRHEVVESIEKYGLYYEQKEFNQVLTASQLNDYINSLDKYALPEKTLSFKSLRPTPVEIGWVIPVNITDLADENFIINSVKCRYISSKGQRSGPLVEQDIDLASYRDNLSDIFEGLKRNFNLQSAVLKEDREIKGNTDIFFSFSHDGGVDSAVLYPLTGLLALYEYENNTNDSSENGNTATIYSGASVSTGRLVTGNNNTDYMSIPYTVMHNRTDFTYATWCKIDTLHTGIKEHVLLSGARTTENNAIIIDYFSGGWHLYINSVKYSFSLNSDIEDLSWHHVAVTRSGSTAKLYIDGVLISTITAISTTLSLSSGGLVQGQEQDTVGGTFQANQSWSGQYDNTFFYSRALDVTEINQCKDYART